MSKHKYTPLIARALEQVRVHKRLLVLAPLASVVGTGALIDTVLYATALLVTRAGFTDAAANLPSTTTFAAAITQTSGTTAALLLALALVIVFAAIWAQAALIHVTYRHARRRKVDMKHAFVRASHNLPSSISLHLLTAVVLMALSYGAGSLLLAAGTEASKWIIFPIVGGFALLFFTVLVFKMLTLQLIAGDDQELAHATHDAAHMVRRSLLGILEYNIAMAFINLGVMIAAYALTFMFGILLFFAVVFAEATTGIAFASYVVNALMFVVFFGVSGVLALFNMAAWSELVRKLEKKPVHSRVVHWIKTKGA